MHRGERGETHLALALSTADDSGKDLQYVSSSRDYNHDHVRN